MMSDITAAGPGKPLALFQRETLVKGQPAQLQCLEINGQTYAIAHGFVSQMRLEDEWYDDVRDPDTVIQALKSSSGIKPDLFTFWQRIPNIERRYSYYIEWESVAVLPITSFDEWFTKKISPRIRSQIRKAVKEGLEVRQCNYDDEFVRGMTEIFNEAPVRQGRRFWHYGKDFATIKAQFSKYLFREQLLGAFFKGEMVGFIMLGDAGSYGLTNQIISKIRHRDKAPNNVLISEAVRLCASKGFSSLVYLYWTRDSLAEFKRRCGFEEVRVPRYFVPLTAKGGLALKLGIHRGWKELVPARAKQSFKELRRSWLDRSS